MPKHFKSKTVRHLKRRYNVKTKRNHSSRNRSKSKYYGSSRHKIGGSVELNIPSIKIEAGAGGTDAETALNQMNNSSNYQNNITKALVGGSGTGTYSVPTFINGGDPYSEVPNPNSVTRALVGAFAQSQTDAEFDKNAIKQSGGKHKMKRNKKNKRKSRKSRKSRK